MAVFTINSEAYVIETANLAVTNTTSAELGVVFTNPTGNDYTIDWGDGTINNSPGHTYGTPYTGNIQIITDNKSLSDITELNSNSGSWSFDLNSLLQFPNVDSIAFGGFTNIITGDISSLSSLNNLDNLTITGNNTVTGDIINLSNLAGNLNLSGNNTVSGNISSLVSLDASVSITGNNTVTGDVSVFNNITNEVKIEGNNTISGSIDGFSDSIQNITITGNNTVTGILSSLPINLNQVVISGNSNISGNINNILPINYTRIDIDSINTTITGNIQDLPVGKPITISTNSDINGGDIGGISRSNYISAEIANVKNNLTYTQGLWNTNNVIFLNISVSNPSFALSASDLDQFLIDLDNSTFIKNGTSSLDELILTGGFTRTTASDSAFNQLVSDGFNITIT